MVFVDPLADPVFLAYRSPDIRVRAPARSQIDKNKKSSSRFKWGGNMFWPPFASFVDQTKGIKGLRPSGVVGDKKKKRKEKKKEERERRENVKEV